MWLWNLILVIFLIYNFIQFCCYRNILQENWRGIPTNLNNIPHSREIREYFYDDVLQATQRAINDGKIRVKVEINIPELNPEQVRNIYPFITTEIFKSQNYLIGYEQDVYRIGTLMELVRVLALSFADDGKRVKVCYYDSDIMNL